MQQLKGAIFDFDGTLLDSMWLWEHIGSEYLKSLGVTPRPDADDEITRMEMAQIVCLLKEEYQIEQTVEEMRAGANKLVEKGYFETLQLKPGVLDMVQSLHADGVKMCIATASDRYLVEAAVERTGLAPYIARIFTCTEEGTSKHEGTIYENAWRWLGTPKDATAVFEDAMHAVQTAKKAGFFVVGVYDQTEAENVEMIRAGSDVFLQSPAEWAAAYQKIKQGSVGLD